MSALLDTILVGQPMAQRRAMAKAITLLESTRTDHRAQADDLLTNLLAHSGSALRIGMSGVPGVGKSTCIEVLGLYLIAQGLRVAVLVAVFWAIKRAWSTCLFTRRLSSGQAPQVEPWVV